MPVLLIAILLLVGILFSPVYGHGDEDRESFDIVTMALSFSADEFESIRVFSHDEMIHDLAPDKNGKQRKTAGRLKEYPDITRIDFSGIRMELGQGYPIWNGEKYPPEHSGLKILLYSEFIGVKDTSIMASTAAYQFQYFDLDADGCYRLHEMGPMEAPGVMLDLKFSRDDRPEERETADSNSGPVVPFMKLDYGMQIRALNGREPLPGVTFDIGKPIMITRDIENTARVSLGEWHLISAHLLEDEASSGDYLLVLTRIAGTTK